MISDASSDGGSGSACEYLGTLTPAAFNGAL